MSEFAGIVQDELRDLRGNAMVGAVVRVREAGTSTPATLYDNPVQISAATGGDALVNDATTGLPAASGLLMPGVDSAANYTFFADSDEEYDLLVTWNGLTFEYRVRPKVLVSGIDSIPPGTYAGDAATTAALATKAATTDVTAEAAARVAADALKTNLTSFLAAQRVSSARELVEDFANLEQFTAVNANAAAITGGWFGSTAGGTDGDAVFPVYGPPKSARFSFVVKATKGTASSKSVVGGHVGATPGVVPTGAEGLFTVGYLQGTGVVIMKDNIGATVTIVADTNIADGAEFGVSVLFDNELGVAPKGNMEVRVTSQAAISNKALTSNVATITTATAHGAVVGSSVTIAGVGTPFDGTWTIASLPSATTLTYAVTNTNVASAAATGTATTTIRGATSCRQDFFPFTNLLVRSNVAAGGIRNLNYRNSALAPQTKNGRSGSQFVVDSHTTGSGLQIVYRAGARPLQPPRLVIYCHGYGETAISAGLTSAAYRPYLEALEKAGFIIAFHDMHLNLWGNNTAMTDLSNLYADFVSLYGADPSVFLFGTSMGAGAAATAILKGLFPVRAAYCVDGVFDLAWANAQVQFTDILTPAYGGSTAALNANDPMQAAASAFGTVPFYISASAADTTVSKTANSDAFVTKLNTRSGVAAVTTRTTTLNHVDASHFLPASTPANFFLANL